MRKQMRRHRPSIQEACIASERSWQLRDRDSHAPRTLAEADSILQTDRMTEISTGWSRKFDFDAEVMGIEQVAFVFGASSGLTQRLHFPVTNLGKLGEQDPYLGNQLGKLITACLSPGR